MTNAQVEVITSVQRRRRGLRRRSGGSLRGDRARCRSVRGGAGSWDPCEPIVSLAATTVRACARDAGFATVAVVPDAASSSMIEVEFASGARMRIAGAADPAMVSAILKTLARDLGRR
jgi:hypothetical protein